MAERSAMIGVLGAALLLCACGREPAAPPQADKAAPGERFVVATRMIADLKPVPATLTTRDMADARARISGVLVRLLVKAGDSVRQGQRIATVRDDRLSFQTGAYDAQAAAAAAQAAQAHADLGRTRDLFSHGVYAQARLDQVEAMARTADANLAAARAQRSASAEMAAQGAVLAPATGRVLVADVPAGSVVMPGQSIARITAGPTVVRIDLPEGQAAALKLGDTVRLAAEDLGGLASEGSISEIYPAVVGGQVTADVSAPGLPRDLVGRRVRAWIKLGERPALVVPRRYLALRYGVDYVQIVRPDGTVSSTPVETAPGPEPSEAEILSGLRAGDVLGLPGTAR